MYRYSKKRSDKEKKEIYQKWQKLINMSQKALDDWAENEDRLLASINREKAKQEGGIQSGYDSFHRIKRRKSKKFEEWTAQDFDNASQENGFNGRMLGGSPGEVVGGSGRSKWEISLRNWGHDPSLKSSPAYSKYQAWKKKNTKTNKKACVIASVPLKNRIVLFKNRDRNYEPELKVFHDKIDGVEILYVMDNDTGWLEGINEYGICIVNSALMVIDDEKEGKSSRLEGSINLILKDGGDMLKVLTSKTIDEAVKVLCQVPRVLGHNIITDGNQIMSIERTKKGVEIGKKGETHIKKLRKDKIHVRTNHGIINALTGYQIGDNRKSSIIRRSKTQNILRKVKKIKDIAPFIYKDCSKNRDNPYNIVRKTDNMFTSSQIVSDPLEKTLYLYLVPDSCCFLGYKKRFSGESKCNFELFRYTDFDSKGNFEIKPKTNPSKIASLYMKNKKG